MFLQAPPESPLTYFTTIINIQIYIFSDAGLSLVGGYCKRLKSKNNIIISELDGYTEFGDQAISCNVDTIFTFHWGIGEA